jgi:hypothetical protein
MAWQAEEGRSLEDTSPLLERHLKPIEHRTVAEFSDMGELHESTHWSGPLPERRRADRKMLRTFAQLMLPNSSQFVVRTYDLGSDGISVVSSVNLRLKSKCEIVFRLPVAGRLSDGIRASASVSHSILSRQQDGFMIGLYFSEIQEPDLQLIRAYMSA